MSKSMQNFMVETFRDLDYNAIYFIQQDESASRFNEAMSLIREMVTEALRDLSSKGCKPHHMWTHVENILCVIETCAIFEPHQIERTNALEYHLTNLKSELESCNIAWEYDE